MKVYTICGLQIREYHVTVQADDERSAKQIAEERFCQESPVEEWWHDTLVLRVHDGQDSLGRSCSGH